MAYDRDRTLYSMEFWISSPVARGFANYARMR
jgi:hypothetical protein